MGRYDEALPAYDIAIKLSPGEADLWHNQGNALAWYNKGVALNLLNRTVEANVALARAEELGS